MVQTQRPWGAAQLRGAKSRALGRRVRFAPQVSPLDAAPPEPYPEQVPSPDPAGVLVKVARVKMKSRADLPASASRRVLLEFRRNECFKAIKFACNM